MEGWEGREAREGKMVLPSPSCRQNRTPKLSRNSRGDVYENRLTGVPNAAVLAKFTPSTGVVVNGLNAAIVAELTGVRMLWFCEAPETLASCRFPPFTNTVPPQPQRSCWLKRLRTCAWMKRSTLRVPRPMPWL